MILALVSASVLTGMLYVFIRPLYLEWQMLKREEKSLETNIGRYRKYADPSWSPPVPMPDGEKTELNRLVPARGNGSEVVVQFEQASSQAGVSLASIERVEDPAELPFQAKQRDISGKEAAETDSDALYESLGIVRDSRLKPVWYKVEVQATKDKLASFLEGLENGQRLTTVAGWEYGWTDAARPEKLVVYVLVYHYQDPGLKMPDESQPSTAPSTPTSTVPSNPSASPSTPSAAPAGSQPSTAPPTPPAPSSPSMATPPSPTPNVP